MISKEAKSAYDRTRYYSGLRISIFKDRRCRCCGILLASKFGAYKTRTYCRDCRDRGYAQKDRSRTYYQRNRARILEKLRTRDA